MHANAVRKEPDVHETTRKKLFIDAYDISSNRGVEFQYSDISPEEIINRENATKIDWIFDTANQYCCIWDEIAFCEIPSNNWERAISVCKNNVILATGRKEWILLQDTSSFFVEIEGKKRHVWIGKPIKLDEVIEITCLKNTLDSRRKKNTSKNISICQFL